MATGPLRMANVAVLSVPQNGATPHIIYADQVIPSYAIQPGMTTQLVGQESGSCNNQSWQNSQVGVLGKFLKIETKTLGAIQIMIGLIHIGIGAVSAILFNSHYAALAAITGCPFWGGLFFIGSGALSVSAEKYLSHCWVKYTVGMNITSAVMALIAMMLYIIEVALHPEYDYIEMRRIFGIAVGAALFIFSFLEFCIATLTAHFGCKAISHSRNGQAMVFGPYTVSREVAHAEGNPVPPAYETVSLK